MGGNTGKVLEGPLKYFSDFYSLVFPLFPAGEEGTLVALFGQNSACL